MFRNNWQPLSEGMYAIGGMTSEEMDSAPTLLAMPNCSANPMHTFNRVFFQGMIIYSKRYLVTYV